MQSQLLDNPLAEANLSVQERAYFGANVAGIDNASRWGLREPDGPLTRTTYVYQSVYQIGSGKDKEYGGIQLRCRVHTYGEATDELRNTLPVAAHRAAYMYDSGIETPGYAGSGGGVRGTKDGDGYLSGFNSVESYRNWESERVTADEMDTSPGVLDWSVEIYTDDSFNDADLSGIAQGVANPWLLAVDEREGEGAVSVAPHKWGLSWNSAAGEYDVHPPGRKQARQRYQPGGAAHDKTVRINGRPIGRLDDNGRTWLNPEYQRGDPLTSSGSWGTYWSREGLVEETGATYQALRDGGTLYLTGETEETIDLVTAAEKPPGYEAVDPDDVSTSLEVREGSAGYEYKELRLKGLGRQSDNPALRVECRRDDMIIKHMGRSNPSYSHYLGPGQSWRGGFAGPGRAET